MTKKIGILGGGQLARMLALEAHKLGLDVYILSPSDNDPAAQVTSNWVKGHFDNTKDLKSFCQKVDVVTFESEFISKEALKILKELEKKKKVEVFPSSPLMEMFQDRSLQKQSLQENKIPTSRFISFEAFDELKKQKNSLSLPLVLKARKNGYDGKGTYILKSWNDKKVDSFCAQYSCGFIAEDFVPFKRELAISLCRLKSGQVLFFPLVETFQEENRCLWVKGPIKHPASLTLKKKLEKYANAIHYVGCITFELFDFKGKLIVNEVAPRVHNSAHYTQDACSLNQFSAHLLSSVDELKMKEKEVRPLSHFAMYNLIGSTEKKPSLKLHSQAKLHWYGKMKNYRGRKMGHLNMLSSSSSKALEILKKERKGFKL